MSSAEMRARFGLWASRGALGLVGALGALGCALQGANDDAASGGTAGTGTASGGAAQVAGAMSVNGGRGGQAGAGECDSDARCSPEGVLEVCRLGEWAKAESCKSAAQCSATRRVCLSCAPGTFDCSDEGVLEQCSVDGSTWESVRDCGSARACVAEGDVGYCVVCTPFATTCEESWEQSPSSATPRALLRECNVTGSGTVGVATCSRDVPVCSSELKSCAACVPNQSVCSGRFLSRCSEGGERLLPVAECASADACDAQRGVCLDGGCRRQGNGGTSAIGDVICEKTTLSICRSSGVWEVLDICASETACNASLSARECLDDSAERCTPGASKCVGDTLRRCAAPTSQGLSSLPEGSWYDYAECAAGCRSTSKDAAECVVSEDGATYVETTLCEPGASTYSVCSSTGCTLSSCQLGTVCAGSALGCTPCVPGGLRCDGDFLMKCDDRGEQESVAEDCRGKFCDKARARCLPARVGERYCDAKGRLLSVSADGTSRLVEDCGSPTLCDGGGCLTPNCAVGAVSCGGSDGNEVFACEDGVVWSDTGTHCAAEQRCIESIGCARPVRVTAGAGHTCVSFVGVDEPNDASARLYCWGANDSGQLGTGATTFGDDSEPRPVLSSLGRDGKPPLVSAMFRPTGLCAGERFTCADVDLPGGGVGVACFGSNERGQLGQNTGKNNAATTPSARVLNGVVQKPVDAGSYFTGLHAVTCGADFACALDADDRGYCWGANDVGQLGSGLEGSVLGVSPVASLSKLAAIVAGGRYACAIDSHAQVYCWGDNARGALGQGLAAADLPKSLVPLRLTGLLSKQVGAGFGFAFSWDQSGRGASSWGQNLFGQLATSASQVGPLSLPLPANKLDASRIDRIVTGPLAQHVCVESAGSLSCWGANPLGELGDGTRIDRASPTVVFDGRESALAMAEGAVALGKAHSCAIAASGAVLCWGANQRQQLGPHAEHTVETTPVVAY